MDLKLHIQGPIRGSESSMAAMQLFGSTTESASTSIHIVQFDEQLRFDTHWVFQDGSDCARDSRQARQQQVLRAYIDGVYRKDVKAVCALFASDADIYDPVGGELHVHGAADIRAFYIRAADLDAKLYRTGPVCSSSTDSAAIALYATVKGMAPLNVISVADFSPGGLIQRYRALWGPGDAAATKDES
jgi:hypothetical protein